MTSIGRSVRQISRDTGYYVPLGRMLGKIWAEPPVAANGLMSSFSTAAWAADNGATAHGNLLSSLSTAGVGGLLKDMGKTLVSSGRVFRKIQLVCPGARAGSTLGVAGDVGTNPNQDYFTGYIELGLGELGGNGTPAPVAAFGR
jgi:hypothetical protein